jgi:hypothetical protein
MPDVLNGLIILGGGFVLIGFAAYGFWQGLKLKPYAFSFSAMGISEMDDFLISLFFEIIGFFVEIIVDFQAPRSWRRKDADSDSAENVSDRRSRNFRAVAEAGRDEAAKPASGVSA